MLFRIQLLQFWTQLQTYLISYKMALAQFTSLWIHSLRNYYRDYYIHTEAAPMNAIISAMVSQRENSEAHELYHPKSFEQDIILAIN